MEIVYELVSTEHSRPVLVTPLGEYLQSRWVKAKEHHAPSVSEVHARDMAAIIASKRHGHAAPQHTGFAMEAFASRMVQPCDLPDVIPGIRIALDLDAKRVRIFDPLETLPNRKEIEAAFLAVYHKYRVPRPEAVYDRISEADLNGWQVWLETAVANGVAELVQPEKQEPVETPAEPIAEPVNEATSEPPQEQPDQQSEQTKEPVQEQSAPVQPTISAPKPVKAHGRRRTSA